MLKHLHIPIFLLTFAIGIVGSHDLMIRAKLAPPFPIYMRQDLERVSYMNKKTMGTCSLVLAIISLVPMLWLPSSLSATELFVVVCILLSIVAAILGFISRKESKGTAITGIVIAIISCLLLCFSLIGLTAYKSATDCVDNGDETSTCKYMGQEIQVPNRYLTPEQYQ